MSDNNQEVQPKSEVSSTKVMADLQQKKWNLIVKILAQAQAIEREAWFVLTDQRIPNRGSFIKLQRAFEKEIVGLKKNKILACEKFALRKDIIQQQGLFTVKGELSEMCQNPGHHLLNYEFDEKQKRMSFILDPQNQSEVYGLGAAIFAKKILCDLSWSESELVQTLSCHGYQRNKDNQQMIELEQFEYTAQGGSLLKLKGKVTENLIVKRKIETQVPLAGSIHVTETEVLAPERVKKENQELIISKPDERSSGRSSVRGRDMNQPMPVLPPAPPPPIEAEVETMPPVQAEGVRQDAPRAPPPTPAITGEPEMIESSDAKPDLKTDEIQMEDSSQESHDKKNSR